MENVVLIGMPASGKSTMGGRLARLTGWRFLDVDREIEHRCGMPLSRIIETRGDNGFRQVENEVNATLDVDHTVIAPGGSVIYGEEAMAHLREIAKVVYLKLSYEHIEERLGDLHARGITFRPGQTLRDLYNERVPLYEKYAHIVLECDGRLLYDLAEELRLRLGIPLLEA